MNDLMQQTGNILAQSQELLKQPEIKGAVSGFLSWIGSKIFANKKAKQERLALIEKQKADEQTINDLKSDIRSIVEDNEELQKELAEKVKEVELLLKKANVQITKTNTVNITGNENTVFQDITGNVTNMKIGRQINQGDNSTYNERKP
jgi:predicted metal-dependent hydrolase